MDNDPVDLSNCYEVVGFLAGYLSDSSELTSDRLRLYVDSVNAYFG